MNGSLGLSNHRFILNVQTENPATARRIYSLLKQFYDVESELLVRRKMKLKKNNLYIVRLNKGSDYVLKDLDILDGFQLKETVPLWMMTPRFAHICAGLFSPRVRSTILKQAAIIWKSIRFMRIIIRRFAK